MPCPTLICIKYEMLALAHEDMRQSAIVGRVVLTRVAVNRIIRRHAATGNLVPGISVWAPRKTTPRQDHALLRMVQEQYPISARVLTVHVRNMYGMRAGWKTINNRLLSRGYRAYGATRKPLLTTNHHRFCLEWAQRWQNLTMAHWQHVILGD